MTFLDILPLCASFIDCDTIKSLDSVSHACHSLTPYLITQHVYETDLKNNKRIKEQVTDLKTSITVKQFATITTHELYIQPLLDTLSSYVTSLQTPLKWSRKEILANLMRYNRFHTLVDEKLYKIVVANKIFSNPIESGLPPVATVLYDLLLQPYCNWHWDGGHISVDPITDKCINLLPYNVLQDILKQKSNMVDDLRSEIILYNCKSVQNSSNH